MRDGKVWEGFFGKAVLGHTSIQESVWVLSLILLLRQRESSLKVMSES